MKFKSLGFLCCLTALFSTTGCLEKRFAEDITKISVDKETVSVPSDSERGSNLVSDTIHVSANRSWIAEFSENVDWVSIDTSGHYDFGNILETVPIVLSFTDNSAEVSRSAKLVISSEAGKREVNITQEAISYRLALASDPSVFLDRPFAADTCKILIKSNADWTIGMKAESGVVATFSQTSGHGTAEVEMYIEENPDLKTKQGSVVISSPKCPEVEFPVSQKKAKPYVKFPKGDVIVAFDGIDDFAIPIKSNTNWTASIESVTGYDESKVSTTAAGDKTATEAWINFPASIDFSIEKASIKVKFDVEGGTPVYATIEQIPALRYCFGDPYTAAFHEKTTALWNKSVAADTARIHKYWPFATYSSTTPGGVTTPHDDGFKWLVTTTREKDGSIAECTTKNGGYVMHMCGRAQGIVLSPTYGLSIGSEVGIYVGAPLVPGRKLVRVDFWLHGGSGLYGSVMLMTEAMKTSGGSILTNGKILVDKNVSYHISCSPEGTEVGKEYAIGLYRRGYWLRTPDITFYYE